MFWTGQKDFNLAPFPSLASSSPVRAVEARRIARYLSASDFIAGTLAISAMGVLRNASENLMKMLRTSPDFILHFWMILDDWSPVTSIYDFYFFLFLLFFVYLFVTLYILYRSYHALPNVRIYIQYVEDRPDSLWASQCIDTYSLSLCINIYNNIYNYT